MYGYIYMTVNKQNGKKYIGKRQKCNFDVKYKGSGVHLKNALQLYGAENFETHILKECVDKQDLNESEKYFIMKYDAVNSKDFYNIASGGDGGNTGRNYKGQPATHIQTEAERFKRSQSLKQAYAEGRHPIIRAGWQKGRHRTEADNEANRLRNSNKAWIHKDGVQTTVPKEKLELYLQNGWERGMLKRDTPSWNKGLTKETSASMKTISDKRITALKDHGIGCCKYKNRINT